VPEQWRLGGLLSHARSRSKYKHEHITALNPEAAVAVPTAAFRSPARTPCSTSRSFASYGSGSASPSSGLLSDAPLRGNLLLKRTLKSVRACEAI
jgi:hypothetical protein